MEFWEHIHGQLLNPYWHMVYLVGVLNKIF
jgi:hypothetical protein